MSSAAHSFAAVKQALAAESPSLTTINAGSPYCNLHRGDGELTTKEITIAGTGAEVITNLFSFTGPFEIVDLWGILTDATDITVLSGCYFDVWDGATSVPITADGLDLSAGIGVVEEATFVKDRVLASPLRLLNADAVSYLESATNKRVFIGGLVQPLAATTCYVRFRCDTDANTDATITVGLAWVCRLPGNAGVVAVQFKDY